jgi:hypothetical protein
MTATVSARWSVSGTEIRLRRLRLANLPAGAVVRIRCTGRRCPFKRRIFAKLQGARVDLLAALGRPAPRLSTGQTLTVLVTAHGYDGKLVRWRLRGARRPKAVIRCVPLGDTRPRPRC